MDHETAPVALTDYDNGWPRESGPARHDNGDARRNAAHPSCEVCGQTLCLSGSGCGCGELEGMRIPGTLTIAVHLGTCHVTYEAQEKHEATAFTYGECECRGGCQCALVPGPAAFTVEREGKTMKVCTRCDFDSDRKTRVLLLQSSGSMEPYMKYDFLGALCIIGMAAERAEKEDT